MNLVSVASPVMNQVDTFGRAVAVVRLGQLTVSEVERSFHRLAAGGVARVQ